LPDGPDRLGRRRASDSLKAVLVSAQRSPSATMIWVLATDITCISAEFNSIQMDEALSNFCANLSNIEQTVEIKKIYSA
jgi:hypothetical protein